MQEEAYRDICAEILDGVQQLKRGEVDRVAGSEPVASEEWPTSFWRAFGRMPADFERPPQIPQKRESFDS